MVVAVDVEGDLANRVYLVDIGKPPPMSGVKVV